MIDKEVWNMRIKDIEKNYKRLILLEQAANRVVSEYWSKKESKPKLFIAIESLNEILNQNKEDETIPD